LTHTSGIIYESPEMERRLLARTPLEEIVEESCRHPLLFEPGSRHSYSDLGYALLGRMAATAAGVPFPELVRTLVLEPGVLTETFMPPAKSEYGRIAYVTGAFAEGTDGAMYNSAYARGLAHPAFGTVATIGDLLRFGLLFAPHGGRRILAEATIRTMATDQTGGRTPSFTETPAAGAPFPWGLGFMVKGQLEYPELLSPAAFGHDGATGCALWIDPDHDLTTAFASNRHLNALGMDAFIGRISRVVNATAAYLMRRV
jgi:CubicO group peptidase (beta-lactamase class C family)